MKLITDSMSSNRTKVLLTLVRLHEMNGRATMREVADGAGLTLKATYSHLKALRDEAYCDWEDGTFGTLRPLVSEVGP